MKERRGYYGKDAEKYKETQPKIKRTVKEAKEKWILENCEEIEKCENKYDI